MVSWLILLVAAIGIVVCLRLWFNGVQCIMRERKSMMESAAIQLAVCREKAFRTRGDPETFAIFERCERIYQQAVDIYNQTLQKPSNYLPARLMGFHHT